ncbi:hypothetical protein A0O34_15600 [Chryseobacterium glaciei]|uniref:DUF4329 domain-containing protein n=1 Tax=Chryseobacterium glaciei TaxID=1685010 RepID=A0A172XXV7_9FLAO|nr:hypothetical protein [Chryseobacterium glaciei]ANF51847.1 hypothetical protein A0O34_15600 [Chryseobacterium glaciei]
MRKKSILRLFLLIVFSISLYSCVHDEIASSTDPSSKEYKSKSLWKEDEKYIKNVMQVYNENETKIKKGNGIPLWDYATTMDRFDESFLMVPVVDNGKVVSVLQVPRHGAKVYFIYTESQNDIAFFQNYISPNPKRALNADISNGTNKLVCVTKTVSTWLPDNEDNPNGTGTWVSTRVTTCTKQQLENCTGIVLPDGECMGGGGDPGYPYPDYGGGGDPQDPEPPEDPCAKTKSIINNPKMQAGLQELKTQSTQGGEKGIKFKADGTPSATITGGAHSVDLGDKTGYAGGYHNHTPSGIPMLSPPDVDQLLGFARAQPTSNPANVNNAYLGMVAPNGMHYVIWFNGNYQDSLTNFSQDQLDNYVNDYITYKDLFLLDNAYSSDHLNLNSDGLEKLFFDTLKNMGLDGKVNLQRIENDGTVKIVSLNSSNQPTSSTCSQ